MTDSEKLPICFKTCEEWAEDESQFKKRHPIQAWYKYSIYYPVRRLWSKIDRVTLEIKWFIQRGKRGWSDCDAWGAFDHDLDVMAGMLQRLSNKVHGHPIGISQRKWQHLLHVNSLRCSLIKSYSSDFKGKLARRELNKLLNFYKKYYFDLWD